MFKVIYFIILLIGCCVFTSKFNILLTLMFLEGIVINLVGGLFFLGGVSEISYIFILVLLVFSVLEACIGLSILVGLIRVFGKGYFSGGGFTC
uniref:NADH dehydrogenase subunit 4L n=1 Tax=Seison sp. MS-2015 TaxID=1673261 RepID=A0A678NPG2_9BILA|nr:NADH dehydrogenase subunit 4L [Seison sp. MS-2015]